MATPSESGKRILLGAALAQADRDHVRLGRMLIERGLITEADLDRALAAQYESSTPLGEILLQQGAVSSADLAPVLADNLRVPFVDVASEPDATLTGLLPGSVCRRLTALPVAQWGRQLVVAMADPNDEVACEEIEQRLRGSVVIAVADPVALRAVIARVHPEPPSVPPLVTERIDFDCPGCGHRFVFANEPWLLRETEEGVDPGRLWIWEHDPLTSTPVHTCSVLSARRDTQSLSTGS